MKRQLLIEAEISIAIFSLQGVKITNVPKDHIVWSSREARVRLALCTSCTSSNKELCREAGIRYKAIQSPVIQTQLNTSWQVLSGGYKNCSPLVPTDLFALPPPVFTLAEVWECKTPPRVVTGLIWGLVQNVSQLLHEFQLPVQGSFIYTVSY